MKTEYSLGGRRIAVRRMAYEIRADTLSFVVDSDLMVAVARR